MKTRLLSLFVALFATTALWAYDFKSGDLYYNIIETNNVKEVAVTYEKPENSSNYAGLTFIDIPTMVTYEGTTYNVTSIDAMAFHDCTSSSITIPNSIVSIGESAFEDCMSLTSIVIPNSVTSIGEEAFVSCTSLVSVSIGNGVTSIEGMVFEDCTALTTITIPNSVTSIGSNAFWGCTGLTSITIPNSVTTIGEEAFSYCTSLTSITIPNSVTTVGEKAFSYCTDLTSITIGNSVTTIECYAFYGCTSLTSVTIPNNVTSIDYGTFEDCTSLNSVTIGNGVTSIGWRTFAGCAGLTSVVIGNNNELSIEAYAFSDCENLTSVTCYANVPPIIVFNESNYDDEGNKLETPVLRGAFDTDRLPKMRLYVPANAISLYKEAEEWKDFGHIAPIGATTVGTNNEQPVVQPTFTDVTITWKITPNAETYTIAITRGTETVYTLVFNADGQLTNIAFAVPSRYGTPRHAPAAVMTEQGYQFTVTGLESGTPYGYTLSVKDSNGKELQMYTGAFTTQGVGTTIDNPSADKATDQTKVIRNGHVLIQHGNKTYTTTGIEVK